MKRKFVKTLLPTLALPAFVGIGVFSITSCSVEQDHSKDRVVFPDFENKTYLSTGLANKTDTKHIEFKCLAENITELQYTLQNDSYIGTPFSSTINKVGDKWFWDFKLTSPETMQEKEGQGYAAINAKWKNKNGNIVQATATIHWYFNFA